MSLLKRKQARFQTSGTNVRWVPIESLVPAVSPEEKYGLGARDLANRIQRSGRFEAIEVTDYAGDGKLYIEDGNTRYAAALLMGMKEVPVGDVQTDFQKNSKLHEHASTQVDLPGGVAAKVMEIGQKLIPDEYLSGEGRVTEPHVTIKYGVQANEQALRQVCARHSPFSGTLGKTQVFVSSENNAGGVPVVIEVHGSQFATLHQEVASAMGTIPDAFPYVPHITIAYVTAKEAQHFAGSDAFAGVSFQATAIILSKNDDNNQVKIPLGRTMHAAGVAPEIPGQVERDEPAVEEPQHRRELTNSEKMWLIETPDQVIDGWSGTDFNRQEVNTALEAEQADRGEDEPDEEQEAPAPAPQREVPQSPRGWRAPKKPAVETTNFKKWFGKSKVVDDEGQPLKVYHGTTHEITEFDMDKTNAENWYGRGFYFSNDPYDVELNYSSDKGGDLTSRVERLAEEIEQGMLDEGGRSNDDPDEMREEAHELARKQLIGPNQGNTMPAYLSLKNPVIVKRQGGTHFELNYDEETGEESGSGMKLYEAVQNVASNWGVDGQKVWGAVFERVESTDFSAYEFDSAVRDLDFIEDDEGSANSGSFLGDVYQEMGFDGIIMDAYIAFGPRKMPGGYKSQGMPAVNPDTKHYIVWEPTKVKSAIGNRGKFDPKNPSITAAYEDEEFEEYTPESWQEMYTLQSGTVLYHGTSTEWQEGDELNFPAWFSTNKKVANWFAHRSGEGMTVIRMYRITNPIQLPVLNDARDIQGFRDMYNIDDSGDPTALAEGVINAGFEGWIIPDNYRPGDDIMLGDGSKIEYIETNPAEAKSSDFFATGSVMAAGTGVGDLGLAKKIMHELMSVLGEQLPEPELKMVNQPRADWLGRDTWKIWIKNGAIGWGDNTIIEVQKSVVNQEETLRRVIAHELCHHADSLIKGVEELTRYKNFGMIGYKTFVNGQIGTGHGTTWKQFAQKFNTKYGADFVTERSDESYAQEEIEIKPFYIMLWRNTNGRLYYAVSSRLTQKMLKFIDPYVGTEDHRITKTNDKIFMHGATIGSGWSYPQKGNIEEKEKKLEELWNSSQIAVPKAKVDPNEFTRAEQNNFVRQWKETEEKRKQQASTAAVSDEAKQRLTETGNKLVEEKTIGDYDFFVGYDTNMGVYQIGMQRSGMDATDIGQQFQRQQQDRGAGSRQELRETLQDWLNKYHILFIGSMNPEKTMKYTRLLKMLGFEPKQENFMGMPLSYISDGTTKTAQKRSEAVTSLILSVDQDKYPEFPSPVLVRWEQGMRWRAVLKAVKAIVGVVSGKRIPWRSIHIWKSPWENYEAQQTGWEEDKSKHTRVMYDVLHNGSYVSVGQVALPYGERIDSWEEAEAVGAEEEPPFGHMADSHKVTPLSDTMYDAPAYGEESNAYANIPERVRGQYDVPSLAELVPQMFEKEGAELPEDDVARTPEEMAQIREEVKDIEYRPVEVVDSHRGELSCEVGAWLNGKPVGFVQFGEYGNVYAEGLQEGDDVPRAIHVKYVYVAPRYRRMGIGTGMYEAIKKEFPGEPIEGSGTTGRGTGFRKKLKERGVLSFKSSLLNKKAGPQGEGQTQHTDQQAVGMSKTLKSDPFAVEMEELQLSVGKQPPQPNPILPTGQAETHSTAKGEENLQKGQ